jgi:hypothetical protein
VWCWRGCANLDFGFNPEEIRYHLLKAGKVPAACPTFSVTSAILGVPRIGEMRRGKY